MEILLLVLTAGLPIIKIVLFPAKTIGRGGNWTIVGAAMIVGLMMALWFGVQSVTDTAGDLATDAATTKTAAAPAGQLPDLDGLSQLF